MLTQLQVIPYGCMVLTSSNRKRRVRSPGHGALEECKPAVRDRQLWHENCKVQDEDRVAKGHAWRQAAIRPGHASGVVRQTALHSGG
eukprot:6622583-Prymnesium_polylepis.1